MENGAYYKVTWTHCEGKLTTLSRTIYGLSKQAGCLDRPVQMAVSGSARALQCRCLRLPRGWGALQHKAAPSPDSRASQEPHRPRRGPQESECSSWDPNPGSAARAYPALF